MANAELDTISSAEATTLDELFRERVRRSGEQIAYQQFAEQDQQWQKFTWADVATQVERWQLAFSEAGLQKGDRVAIALANRVEWVVFDQAALRLGLVVVPLYVSDRADNMAYVLGNSGARLVLLANAEAWHAMRATDENIECVERVLLLSGQGGDTPSGAQVSHVDDWLPEHGQHLERGMAEADDLATIVYTSGTTGRPKGVMLSHKNLMINAYAGMRSVALTPNDHLLSFLPLSHTLERTVGYYAALMSGSRVSFNRSIKQLSDDLAIIKPTVLISVPRIFERVHNRIFEKLESEPSIKQKLFRLTRDSGWQRFQNQQGIASWKPISLIAPLLHRLVAKPILKRFGGRLRFVIVGGAPLSIDVAKTFVGLGLPLLQGYGLTEASPVVSVNTLERNRPDSIGMLLRGVQAALGENDELLVHADSVMQGYWQNDDASEKSFYLIDDKKWLRTGDRASVDENGFLRIIGRIKDILVLANGEKVPPADIEAAILRDPLFEQVLVLGEGKSFLSALLVLNKDKAVSLPADLQTQKETLINRIAGQMDDFPGYAKIRKVAISPEEWTIESGLMTPTLKIKRPKVIAHYQALVRELYDGHGVHKS